MRGDAVDDIIFSQSGTLRTYFSDDIYTDGTHSDTALAHICCAAAKSSSATGGSGRIYIKGSAPLAAEGEVIGGKTVRRQSIITGGYEFPVKAFRRVYWNGVLHHCEVDIVKSLP